MAGHLRFGSPGKPAHPLAGSPGAGTRLLLSDAGVRRSEAGEGSGAVVAELGDVDPDRG